MSYILFPKSNVRACLYQAAILSRKESLSDYWLRSSLKGVSAVGQSALNAMKEAYRLVVPKNHRYTHLKKLFLYSYQTIILICLVVANIFTFGKIYPKVDRQIKDTQRRITLEVTKKFRACYELTVLIQKERTKVTEIYRLIAHQLSQDKKNAESYDPAKEVIADFYKALTQQKESYHSLSGGQALCFMESIYTEIKKQHSGNRTKGEYEGGTSDRTIFDIAGDHLKKLFEQNHRLCRQLNKTAALMADLSQKLG